MIRLYRATSVLLVIMIGGCMSGPRVGTPAGEDASEMGKTMIRSLGAAFDAADASAIAAMFTDDAILLPSQAPEYRGRDAIRNFYTQQFKDFSIRVEGVAVETRIFGDYGYTMGTYTATLNPKNGGPAIVEGGRYLSIIQRQPDGSWKSVREMSNSGHP